MVAQSWSAMPSDGALQGLVAVLDAFGARAYTREDPQMVLADLFEVVRHEALQHGSQQVLGLQVMRDLITFNNTIAIVFVAQKGHVELFTDASQMASTRL
jgi:hypothetical protein